MFILNRLGRNLNMDGNLLNKIVIGLKFVVVVVSSTVVFVSFGERIRNMLFMKASSVNLDLSKLTK